LILIDSKRKNIKYYKVMDTSKYYENQFADYSVFTGHDIIDPDNNMVCINRLYRSVSINKKTRNYNAKTMKLRNMAL